MRTLRRHLTPLAVLTLLLVALVAPLGSSSSYAQDDNPNPAILICVTDAGCWHSDKSGEVTGEQMGALLGDEDPHGENTVICTTTEGCQWSALDPDEAELTFSGDEDGPDGEKQPAPDMDQQDSDQLFPPTEVEEPSIMPVEGSWTAYNLAGVMTCPGAMTLDIPASDPLTGELLVSEDGSELTAESLDPELATVSMIRVGDGVYHATIELSADGGTMTLNFDEVFVANTLAFGMIHGQIEQQGMECTITRPFYTIVEGLELLEPGSGAETDDSGDSE